MWAFLSRRLRMWVLLAIALPLTRALVHRLAVAAVRRDPSARTAKALFKADSTVTAVSRFSSQTAIQQLNRDGIETIACDLLNRDDVAKLPRCPNVLFLSGRKFGSTDRPDLTWMTNTVLPSYVASHYRASKIVAFSTGNVYGLSPIVRGGSRESDPMFAVGDAVTSQATITSDQSRRGLRFVTLETDSKNADGAQLCHSRALFVIRSGCSGPLEPASA